MKMCWLRGMEDMQLPHKHQVTGKRGLEVTDPGQGMIKLRAKPAVISWPSHLIYDSTKTRVFMVSEFVQT